MPWGDGTGPNGTGPEGRGRFFCRRGNGNFANQPNGQRGMGFFCRRLRRNPNVPNNNGNPAQGINNRQRRQFNGNFIDNK